jgi:hypothetical protein
VIFNISVSNAITKLHKVMKEISLISGMLQRLKCHGILFFLHLPEQVNGDNSVTDALPLSLLLIGNQWY